MFGLYTKKQLEEEISKRMYEADKERWQQRDREEILKRLWAVEAKLGMHPEPTTTCFPEGGCVCE